MNVSFVEEGREELSGRFSSTFIGLKGRNCTIPMFIRSVPEVDRALKTITISGIVLDTKTLEWVPTTGAIPESELQYFAPPPGMRNFENGAVFYDQVPLRHRYRGLTNDQVKMVVWGPERLADKTLNNTKLLWAVWNPSFLPFEEAYESVRRKKTLAAAFHKNFALVKHKEHASPVLVYKTRMVGLYDRRKGAIRLPEGAHHLAEMLAPFSPVIKD